MLSTADAFVIREQIPAAIALRRVARGEPTYEIRCSDSPDAPIYFPALRTAQTARGLLGGEGVESTTPVALHG